MSHLFVVVVVVEFVVLVVGIEIGFDKSGLGSRGSYNTALVVPKEDKRRNKSLWSSKSLDLSDMCTLVVAEVDSGIDKHRLVVVVVGELK